MGLFLVLLNTRFSAAQPAVIAYPYRQTSFYGLTALQIIMRMVRRLMKHFFRILL